MCLYLHVLPRDVLALEQSSARPSPGHLSPGRDLLVLAAGTSTGETTAAEEEAATERISSAAVDAARAAAKKSVGKKPAPMTSTSKAVSNSATKESGLIGNGIGSDFSADYGTRRGGDRDTRSGGQEPAGMVAIGFTAVARGATRASEGGANPSTTRGSTWVVPVVAAAALSRVSTVYASNGDSHVDDGLDGDA